MIAIHPPITSDLRQHRGGRYGPAKPISPDQRGLRKIESGNAEPVDDHMVGFDRKPLERQAHRAKGGAADIPAIDAGGRDGSDPPPVARGQDQRDEAPPLGGREEFRVGEAGDRDAGPQDDRCSDDGARDAAPSDLIGAGDVTRTSPALCRFPPAARSRGTGRGSSSWASQERPPRAP